MTLVMLIWGCAMLFIPGALIYQQLDRSQLDRELAAGGVRAEASVIERRTRSRSHFVTYAFMAPTAGGPVAQFRREEKVDAALYAGLQQGSPLAIDYVRGNPGRARIAGAPRPAAGDLLWLIPACLFPGALGVLALRSVARDGAALWRRAKN